MTHTDVKSAKKVPFPLSYTEMGLPLPHHSHERGAIYPTAEETTNAQYLSAIAFVFTKQNMFEGMEEGKNFLIMEDTIKFPLPLNSV